MRVLTLDDDRLLPPDPGVRGVAREIYAAVRGLPIVSMHGHVDAALLAHNLPFPDPAQLLVVPDHYVTRMLVSQGATFDELTTGDPREIWRRFCAEWHLFRGTPSRLWLEHELVEVFGLDITPSAETADLLYDELSAALRRPGFRPRALFERFGIEILATTDSPLERPRRAPLDHRVRLAGRGGPDLPSRCVGADRPAGVAGQRPAARRRLRPRRAPTPAISPPSSSAASTSWHGARATDHGIFTAETEPLDAVARHASTSRRCAVG